MRMMTLKTGFNINKRKKIKDMKNFISYEEAKNIAQTFGIKSRQEWNEYSKTEQFKNVNLPKQPDLVYKTQGWISWSDFLGAGNFSDKKSEFLTYEEAKKQMRELDLNSVSEWRMYTKSENFRNNMPKSPEQLYKNNGWISWKDFLGASE